MGTVVIILFVFGLVGFIIGTVGVYADDEGSATLGMFILGIAGTGLVIIGVVYLVCWLALITNAAIVTVNG